MDFYGIFCIEIMYDSTWKGGGCLNRSYSDFIVSYWGLPFPTFIFYLYRFNEENLVIGYKSKNVTLHLYP